MFFEEVVDGGIRSRSALPVPTTENQRRRSHSRRSTRGRKSLVPVDDDMDTTLKAQSQEDKALSVDESNAKKLRRIQKQRAKIAQEIVDEECYLRSLRDQLLLWEELIVDASNKVQYENNTKEVATSEKLIPKEYRKALRDKPDYNRLLDCDIERFKKNRLSQYEVTAANEEVLELEESEHRKLTDQLNAVWQARKQPNMFDLVDQWQTLNARFREQRQLLADLSVS